MKQPFDEINAFKTRLVRYFDENGRIASRQACEDIIDELLDLFLLAYAEAVDAINSQFRTEINPATGEIQETIYRRIDGADWRERVFDWYMNGGNLYDIERIAETEVHRIYNDASLNAATKAGASTKTWNTMLDDRVRDTHDYLERTTVPLDAEFYTYDGDHALYPGGFQTAENNVNCRCFLTYH